MHFYHFIKSRTGAIPPKTAMLGGAGAIAAVLLMQLEGLRHHTYLDQAGVATICYGHTATARPGQTRSDAQCTALLAMDMASARRAVTRHVTVPLSEPTKAALISFVYNVGGGAFQKSSLLRLLNQGDIRAACAQMKRWVCVSAPRGKGDVSGQCATRRKNKRKSNGLVLRRMREEAVCLSGM
jgi:lysozyme